MLVHERGDELHLLAAVPDWWLGEGEDIRVERAPTHSAWLANDGYGKNTGSFWATDVVLCQL